MFQSKPGDTQKKRSSPILERFFRLNSGDLQKKQKVFTKIYVRFKRNNSTFLIQITASPSQLLLPNPVGGGLFSFLEQISAWLRYCVDVNLIYVCKFVNATLLSYLRLANIRFATRPLFSVPRQEIALNGAQHCQLRPDVRFISHVSFFTTYSPDYYQVFLINNQLYSFENFTLTRQSNFVFRIYPTTYKFLFKLMILISLKLILKFLQ